MLKLQQGSRAALPVLRKAFRLFVEQVDEVDPNDVAYVHACYAPLSIRLVEHAIARPGKRRLLGTWCLLSGACHGGAWQAQAVYIYLLWPNEHFACSE